MAAIDHVVRLYEELCYPNFILSRVPVFSWTCVETLLANFGIFLCQQNVGRGLGVPYLCCVASNFGLCVRAHFFVHNF